ncbi:hypothetical protein D3C72_2203560 [compost metagenome]
MANIAARSARSCASARRQKWPNHSAEKIKINTYSHNVPASTNGNRKITAADDTHSSVGAEPSSPTATPITSSGVRWRRTSVLRSSALAWSASASYVITR